MGLLDIPPEIIDLIINLTLPDGIESFSLSCRVIYERAQSAIKCHNNLKRRWRHTTNASPARRGDTLSILYEISCEPITAEYILFLGLWDRRAEHEVDRGQDGYDFRNDEDAMQRIKELLSSAEYNSDADPEEWWPHILSEDAADEEENVDKLFATVALLALLPNLKTLQLPDRWHEVRKAEAAETLVPYVELLVSKSNDSKRRLRPLASLETLLPFVEEGYEVRAGLQCLQPFMTLKGIRNLYGVSCVAVEDDWGDVPTFQWPNPALKSPLTRIELASCCMDAGGLSSLLVNTPAVTIFRYSHQTKWDGLEYDWNPGEFIEALSIHCGDRLEELAITIDELHGEIVNGLSSFLRFTKLRRLEVDVLPFCGPPLESGQRLGHNAIIPARDKPWTHIDIPCMGDMLPPSICELTVNTDFPDPSEQALKALFKNIKDRKRDQLRNLEKAVIRQYKSSSAQQLADNFGVSLEAFEMNVADPRARSMMPLWKREFDSFVGGIVMTTG
jgi:hypothetical protein